MATQLWSRPSVFSDAPTAEEHVGRALRRLLRGGTWESLANEIAWEAARSTGFELSCLEWLPGLIEAGFSARLDGLEFVLEPARVSARAAHLRVWPHDLAGAETAATLAADEEADRRVSRLYVEMLDWASALLADRLSRASGSHRSRRARLGRRMHAEEPRVPAFVADNLTRTAPRYGWPARDTRAGHHESH